MRGVLVVCLVMGCWRATSAPRTTPIEQPRQPITERGEMYALDEALADALSGPLVHIATGPWFGLSRINACVYRNERVFVVNIYCTTKEMNAFSIVVFSPARGRAVIYAEAEKPISQLRRPDYFTFKAETHPNVPDPFPPVSLAWSYGQLTAWDEKRYYKYAPGCWGGIEIRNPTHGCLRELKGHANTWMQRNHEFLDNPPEDWYRILREMRARAKRDGKHVANPGG
jgi:hypothetical protein